MRRGSPWRRELALSPVNVTEMQSSTSVFPSSLHPRAKFTDWRLNNNVEQLPCLSCRALTEYSGRAYVATLPSST